MEERFIECEVTVGLFPNERIVKFRIGDNEYQIIADKDDVPSSSFEEPMEGKWIRASLRVYVVKKNGGTTLINLPSETMSSGRRLAVPQQLLRASA